MSGEEKNEPDSEPGWEPFITVHLDRPRRLRFTIGAMKELEHITGRGITQIPEIEIDISMLEKLTYCALKWDDPSLDQEKVQAILEEATAQNPRAFNEILTKVTEALSQAFGGQDQLTEEQREKLRGVMEGHGISPGGPSSP